MSHGGARAGAGRKKGGANKLTREAVEKAQSGGIMPLDYLLEVMRDAGEETTKRIDAAKAAAPYVHPKLQPVDQNGSTEQAFTYLVTGVERD